MSQEPLAESEAAAPPAAPAAPARSRGSVGDMARSLAVLVAIVLAVGGFILFQPKPHDAVQVVDINPAVADARAAHAFPVQVPQGLPVGWRATSARDQVSGRVVELHLGYVTPSRHYAAVEQSNGDAAAFLAGPQVLGGRGAPAGTVVVHGVAWQRYRISTGTALVRQGGAVTTAVLGTAPQAELVALAGSLR